MLKKQTFFAAVKKKKFISFQRQKKNHLGKNRQNQMKSQYNTNAKVDSQKEKKPNNFFFLCVFFFFFGNILYIC